MVVGGAGVVVGAVAQGSDPASSHGTLNIVPPNTMQKAGSALKHSPVNPTPQHPTSGVAVVVVGGLVVPHGESRQMVL